MSERLGEWLTPLCSHQLAQVAEHASSVVKKAINLENVLLVVVVEEATELASNATKKATCQENAPILEPVEELQSLEVP